MQADSLPSEPPGKPLVFMEKKWEITCSILCFEIKLLILISDYLWAWRTFLKSKLCVDFGTWHAPSPRKLLLFSH